MYRVEPNFLNDLIKDKSKASAGRLCKRLENLEKADFLSPKACALLKDDLKDIIYESFRDVKQSIKYHNSYKLYNPTK